MGTYAYAVFASSFMRRHLVLGFLLRNLSRLLVVFVTSNRRVLWHARVAGPSLMASGIRPADLCWYGEIESEF